MLIETKAIYGENILINIDNVKAIYGSVTTSILFVTGEEYILNESYESFLEKIKSEQERKEK